MNRRNSKKHIDTKKALKFVQLVLNRLEECSNTRKKVTTVAQECIEEMPKFDTQPALKKRYTNILNSLATGSYSADIVATYFRKEDQRLCHEIAAL